MRSSECTFLTTATIVVSILIFVSVCQMFCIDFVRSNLLTNIAFNNTRTTATSSSSSTTTTTQSSHHPIDRRNRRMTKQKGDSASSSASLCVLCPNGPHVGLVGHSVLGASFPSRAILYDLLIMQLIVYIKNYCFLIL